MSFRTITALVVSLLCISGCNTFAGVGRDISYAGGSMMKWSTDMRDEIPSTGYVGEDTNRLVVSGEQGAALPNPQNNAFTTSYQPNTISGASDEATYRAHQASSYQGLHRPTYQQY